MLLFALLAACTSAPPATLPDWPAPAAWGPLTGPGMGQLSPGEAPLFEGCATLLGDERDVQHHNLVGMHDGYLIHPWAPEWGGGGVTLYDMSQPCAPVKVGEAYHEGMRETHTIAIGEAQGRTYLAVDTLYDEGARGGVGFFDLTDPTAPTWVGGIDLPGFHYPDAYVRVTLSATWVGDLLYVAGGGNGLYVLDVSDPKSPVLLEELTFSLPFIVGSFHVIGPLGLATSAGLSRVALLDLSDPARPKELPGGIFDAVDHDGVLRPFYFSNVSDHYLMLARKNAGGGPIIYDLAEPGLPKWVGDYVSVDGDGGYIAAQGPWLFQGESEFGAVYDISDPSSPVEFGRFTLKGDLDTVTPAGQVALVSVDEGPTPGRATEVVPWSDTPDTEGPRAGLILPRDGELNVAPNTRIGVLFDEDIEWASAHAGSLRVTTAAGAPVAGSYNVMGSALNFTPSAPLALNTTYVVTVVPGGITDWSGNPTRLARQVRFSTGSTRSWR